VRYLLLALVAVIFLTGVVWWAVFLGNAIRGSLRKR
jgi:cytoskeletal protein RodZ